MDITVENVSVTDRPLTFIGRAAGTSTDRTDKGDPVKRALGCIRMGHGSVLEHVGATFRISGVSRNCTHQLVRHRLASYTELSQRYTKLDVTGSDWYVVPPTIAEDENASAFYRDTMKAAACAYLAMVDDGIPAEDARFALPGACKSTITVTMNLREFKSFHDLRSDRHAQWEIRAMSDGMLDALREETKGSEEWQTLLDKLFPAVDGAEQGTEK